MKVAVIENNKVVNIIECGENGATGIRFPLGQFTYNCGDYPVSIGDDFADGIFTREGVALEIPPTPEQMQIAELMAQVETLTAAVKALTES